MSIFETCVAFFPGLLLVSSGIFMLNGKLWNAAANDRFWKKLVKWRVFGDSYPSPQAFAEIKQSWSYLCALITIGGGVAIVLTVTCIVLFSLATAATPFNDSLSILATLYCSVCIGCGMGGVFAVWRMRRAAKSKITYADLRSRRVSDYRSGLLCLLPLVTLVSTLAFSWFFVPRLGPILRFSQSDGRIVDVAGGSWIIGVVPVAMVAIFLVVEFLMFRLARLSRLLITGDPVVSRRVDDMFRATVIGMVQCVELFAILYLGIVQVNLVLRGLWGAGYWQMGNRPYVIIPDVFFNLLLFAMIFVAVLAAAGGRLGGKISGWPWQVKQIRQSGVGL